ncbi:hypothetical protein LTR78_010112 [Recurvomyces mirabilis]|uniref:Uncharacterized protein n=1 Tax=Recurvomyces mirabilis TaxID=574656 RepID=A0AAE0WIC2_9PEZI|nr:hypothetical protein LTR78_010112 [Recurvomyces mirabilis]KAK5150063.1 hypothetical protein LTS14_010428 [Recurvomyces mirabilis]
MASSVSLDRMVFYPGPPSQSTARKSFEHFAASRSHPGEAVFSISSACHQPPADHPGAGMDTGSRTASIIAPSHSQELHPSQLLSRAAGNSPVREAMQTPDATFSTASMASTAASLSDSHVSLAESVVAACSSPLQIEHPPTRSSVAKLLGHAEKLCWDTTTSAEPGVPFRTEDTDDNPAMSSTGGVSSRELLTEQPSARFISCLSPPTFLEPGRHSDGLSTRLRSHQPVPTAVTVTRPCVYRSLWRPAHIPSQDAWLPLQLMTAKAKAKLRGSLTRDFARKRARARLAAARICCRVIGIAQDLKS